MRIYNYATQVVTLAESQLLGYVTARCSIRDSNEVTEHTMAYPLNSEHWLEENGSEIVLCPFCKQSDHTLRQCWCYKYWIHNKHNTREQVNSIISPHVNACDNDLLHSSDCKKCVNLRSLTIANEMISQRDELQAHVNQIQLKTVKSKLSTILTIKQRHDALEVLIREGMVSTDARISLEMRERITKLILEYHDVWHLQDSDHGDCGPQTTLDINTGAHKPIFIPARRVKPHQLKDVCAKLQEYIKTNILIPSNSPWQVPLVVVPKKTGGVRICCDYRQLNDVTCKDCFQIPDTQAIIDAVGEHKPEWLSNTDMHAGYHQMRMSPESIDKTAIGTPLGQFSFIMVPFGLTNAPSHYQRVMQEHLGNMKELGLFIYLDDVLIVSETFELHFETFEKMLERVRAAGMLLSPKKCALFNQSVKFVGYTLAAAGISIDEDKVKRHQQLSDPYNCNERPCVPR